MIWAPGVKTSNHVKYLILLMTTLGWLPNAQRDIPVTSWFKYWLALNLWKNDIFLIVSRFSACVALLDFFAKVQETRELIKNCELNLYVSRDGLSYCTKTIISRWAFGSQPSAVIARVLNKNAVSWQTRNNRQIEIQCPGSYS